MEIDYLLSSLGLAQIITEPTNFEPNKNPSCIDLIITDQPNLILDCGTRASLDSYCHHQLIYYKVNFRIPPPPPFERKIWHFNRANTAAIKKSMNSFPWHQHLNTNTDPNWQVKTFIHIFLNIMSCKAKANHFNDFFAKQCKLIINNSVLPNFSPLTNKRIDHITIKNEEIISLIRNLNPNKANGYAMILLFYL